MQHDNYFYSTPLPTVAARLGLERDGSDYVFHTAVGPVRVQYYHYPLRLGVGTRIHAASESGIAMMTFRLYLKALLPNREKLVL